MRKSEARQAWSGLNPTQGWCSRDTTCPEQTRGGDRQAVNLVSAMSAREKVFRADDFAMQCARYKRVAFHLAMLGVGNRDVIDFQSAADGALIPRFGLEKIRQSAQFRGLGGD